MFATLEDNELVELTRRGDNEAFAELTRRYQSICQKSARLYLRTPEDAEEEVQNAFWKAYQNIDSFRGDAKFSTWLNRILINQCLMRLRKLARTKGQVSLEVEVNGEVLASVLAVENRDPETELAGQEVVSLVRSEVKRIPPKLRRSLELADFEEAQPSKMGGLLGISDSAAKSRLLRARRLLKERMEHHLGRRGLATLTTA